MIARAVGQRIDEPRHLAVDARPVVGRRPAQSGRVRDRRQVQDQVRRAAERGVHHHARCAATRRVSTSRIVRPRALERHQRTRRSARHVEPDRVARTARAREWPSDMPSASPTTCDGRRRPEELASAAGRRAGAAADIGRVLERDLAVREPRADGLHARRVFAFDRQQRHAAGHQHAGQIAASPPAPSSSPAAPCRTSRRRARRGASAAIGSVAGRSSPHRCGTAGCRTSPSCPACGRRTDRCMRRQTGPRRPP